MATLNDVQKTVSIAIDRDWEGKSSQTKLTISLVGLAEEVGEVEGLFKRQLRNEPRDVARSTQQCFIEEIGDVLWYLAAVCECKGISLEHVWEYNQQKLEERYHGSQNV